MTDTDTAAPLTTEEIAAIKKRLASVPGGDWHSALGSGHNAMTAVMADVPDGEDDYEPVFICDVIPDYRVEDPQVWENRVPLLDFIAHAPTDIDALLTSNAALRDRLARAEAREDGMRQALDDARRVLLHTYDSITEYGRYDSDTAADVIHAVHDITDALGEGLRFTTLTAPSDGAARAGDAAGDGGGET